MVSPHPHVFRGRPPLLVALPASAPAPHPVPVTREHPLCSLRGSCVPVPEQERHPFPLQRVFPTPVPLWCRLGEHVPFVCFGGHPLAWQEPQLGCAGLPALSALPHTAGRQVSSVLPLPPELLSCTRPPQQLPDVPPHLPPARPPRRPHQARPLQRHLRQPWPGDRHAQLPWDACQGHQDHGESSAALAAPLRDLHLLGCGSCASGCTLATQSGRPCPGECAGGADRRAPPTPTEPGLEFPKTSWELGAFPRWLYPWLSVLATHGIPGDVEKTLMLGPRDSDSMGSAPWTVQYGHIGDLLHYYTCPLPSWPERLTNTVWRAVELKGGLEEIGRWTCSRDTITLCSPVICIVA